ncbi:MAG: hypothetical protein ACJ74Q_15490 [Pyrinomonadaceae bacterium]
MSLAQLLLADVRLSARRAHAHFHAGRSAEAREQAERIAVLLVSLRERYDSDSPFHQLVREAMRRSLPEAFAPDLFIHDRTMLDSMSASPEHPRFVWILHDCGSFLLDARDGQTPSYLASQLTRSCGRHHVYLFEGGLLTEIARGASALAA